MIAITELTKKNRTKTKAGTQKKQTTDYTPEQLNSFWSYKRNALNFLNEPINPPLNHAVQVEMRGPLPNKQCERAYKFIFRAMYETISRNAKKKLDEL